VKWYYSMAMSLRALSDELLDGTLKHEDILPTFHRVSETFINYSDRSSIPPFIMESAVFGAHTFPFPYTNPNPVFEGMASVAFALGTYAIMCVMSDVDCIVLISAH